MNAALMTILTEDEQVVKLFMAAVAAKLNILAFDHSEAAHDRIVAFARGVEVRGGCACVDELTGASGTHERLMRWISEQETHICGASRWPGRPPKRMRGKK